jgi:nicotinate-nucleotide adenylyltransferase
LSVSRLGILGGTFDPPHLGHLLLAENALGALQLDTVLFIPAAAPPHKHGKELTATEHRLRMVELAIADNPRFALSKVDVNRPGPHYSVDMLRLVQAEYPAAGLFFLMGSDSLRDFARWHDPAGILTCAMLGVMMRPGAVVDLTPLKVALPGIEGRLAFVDSPAIGISSTTIRQRMWAGQSIRYYVPAAVADYIAQHGLYENSEGDDDAT